MSKKSAREWLAAILICIFGTFLIGGLIAALESHGYASSEAAGWMQAIGSVVAIAVAIYVMREQERMRRAEALTIARIALATMIPGLYALSNGLADVRAVLQNMSDTGESTPRFAECLEYLRRLDLWRVEELARLAPLPSSVAYKMTSIVGSLHMTIHAMTGVVGDPRMQFDLRFIRDQAMGNKMLLDGAFEHANDVLLRAQFESQQLR